MTLSENSLLNGLILIGGRSLRMQNDKSSLHYHSHNQRDHLVQLLTPLCSQVFLSCNVSQAVALAGEYNIIEDIIEGIGPIGGIHAAFKKFPTAAWLVVACDLPFLSDKTLSYLISNRHTGKQATGFRSGEQGFPEPLLTIYEPTASRVLSEGIEKKEYSPSRALSRMDVAWLAIPDRNELKNVNDPEAYRRTLGEIRSPLK